MKKDKIINITLLGISIAVFAAIWGTFYGIINVEKAWVGFFSAAIFFAAGHKLKDSINVALSHLLGVGFGLAVLYLLNLPIVDTNRTLYTFLILAVFGFMSAIFVNTGIPFLSHLPSLFCGWAIAFAVFGDIPVSAWIGTAIYEVLLVCVIGVLFVGVGISQLHSFLLKIILKTK